MNRNPIQISAALEALTPQVSAFSGTKLAVAGATTLKKATGKKLVCVEGALWVTQTGNPGDHVLVAGQSLTLAGRGSVVVSTLPGGSSGSYVLA